MTSVANSSSLTLHNQYEFEALCCQRGGDILGQALKFPVTIPGRIAHIDLSVAELVDTPGTIIARVATAIRHLLYDVPVDVIKRFRGEGTTFDMFKRLFGHITHVIVLDPLHILAMIAGKITRIFSGVLGFIYPKAALRGWQVSLSIEKHANQFFSNMWKWLFPKVNDVKINQSYVSADKARIYTQSATDSLQRILIDKKKLDARDAQFRADISTYFTLINSQGTKSDKSQLLCDELNSNTDILKYLVPLQKELNEDEKKLPFCTVVENHLKESPSWDISTACIFWVNLQKVHEKQLEAGLENKQIKELENNILHHYELSLGKICVTFRRF